MQKDIFALINKYHINHYSLKKTETNQ